MMHYINSRFALHYITDRKGQAGQRSHSIGRINR